MPADRLRVLVPALVALAMIVGSGLVLDWFVVETDSPIALDLRGLDSTAASATLWISLLFAIVVVMQVCARLFAEQVSQRFTRAGYLIGVTLFGSAFMAGYMFGPAAGTHAMFDVDLFFVHRTWAPLMMVGGAIAGMVALYYATLEENISTAILDPIKPDLAPARALPRKDMLKLESKPDVVAKPDAPSPSDTTRDSQRARTPTSQRTRAPSQAEISAEMSGTTLRPPSSSEATSDVRDSQRSRTPTSSGLRDSQRTRAPSQAEISAEMSGTTLRASSSSETTSGVRDSQRSRTPTSGGLRDSQRTRAPSQAEISAEMSGTTLRAPSSSEATPGVRDSQSRTPTSSGAPLQTGVALRPPSDSDFTANDAAAQSTQAPQTASPSDVRESQRTRAPTRPPSASDVREPVRGRAPTNAEIAAEMSGVKLRAASSSDGENAPAIARTATSARAATSQPVAARTATSTPVARTTTPDKPAIARTTTPDKQPAVARTTTPDKPAVARTTTPDKPAVSRTATPHKLRGKLKFAALTAELTRGGVDARREDGSPVLVVWRDVVGAVARRLPDDLDAEPFVDLVSTAGSTLRIVPWTRLEGDAITGEDRALALLRYIVGHCPDITLDPATRAFIEGRAGAAQLPDVATLTAHDERLS